MLYVLLPAYNEEKSMQSLLERFKKLFAENKIHYLIVVVDDGSTDRTAETVNGFNNEINISLVPHPYNMGLGAAMRTGFDYIAGLSKPGDLILTMDADDTHNPSIVGDMIQKIQKGKDIIIASRYEHGGEEIGLALHRKILSLGASFLLKIFFPIEGVKDYTCGFRLYSADIIKKAVDKYKENFITHNSFVCMAEILIKLSYLGVKVDEVPLILRYDLKQGQSKMKKIRTIFRYIHFIFREKFKSDKNNQ
ncbi:MAG: glycosyltransferase [Desulfatiglans sp.]|jgi:dolichol-phosphate mannosyltransferase|nr:glycosyltransferase [Desulfatiglans sp.]